MRKKENRNIFGHRIIPIQDSPTQVHNPTPNIIFYKHALNDSYVTRLKYGAIADSLR